MLDSLLSGAIGSIVGVVGAFLAAYFAFGKTRDHEAGLARREHVVAISGDLAHALVRLYEELRIVDRSERADADLVPVADYRNAEQELRRAITVDAPLLGAETEAEMKKVRDELRVVFDPRRSEVPAAEIRRLVGVIRPAGDSLRKLRRATLKDAPSMTVRSN